MQNVRPECNQFPPAMRLHNTSGGTPVLARVLPGRAWQPRGSGSIAHGRCYNAPAFSARVANNSRLLQDQNPELDNNARAFGLETFDNRCEVGSDGLPAQYLTELARIAARHDLNRRV